MNINELIAKQDCMILCSMCVFFFRNPSLASLAMNRSLVGEIKWTQPSKNAGFWWILLAMIANWLQVQRKV